MYRTPLCCPSLPCSTAPHDSYRQLQTGGRFFVQQPFSPAAYASQITAEQIRWLYTHAFPGFVATLLNASIVVAVLLPAAPPAVLGAWWAWMMLVTVGRFLLVQRYRQVAPAVTHADYWRWWFVCGAGATGLGWGFAGLYLFPSDGYATNSFSCSSSGVWP